MAGADPTRRPRPAHAVSWAIPTPQEVSVKKLIMLVVLVGIGFAIVKMMNVETKAH